VKEHNREKAKSTFSDLEFQHQVPAMGRRCWSSTIQALNSSQWSEDHLPPHITTSYTHTPPPINNAKAPLFNRRASPSRIGASTRLDNKHLVKHSFHVKNGGQKVQ
jgi:hypothetical protein